jgi:hypothetical protein
MPKKPESEQLNVRLPTMLIKDLKDAAERANRPLTQEIRERLAGSVFDDARRVEDPELEGLLAQISELSHRVRRHYGIGWHAEANARDTFVKASTLLLADIARPSNSAQVQHPAEIVAEVIYRGYAAEIREIQQGKRTSEMRPTPAEILKRRRK